jgi:hypothetical protein
MKTLLAVFTALFAVGCATRTVEYTTQTQNGDLTVVRSRVTILGSVTKVGVYGEGFEAGRDKFISNTETKDFHSDSTLLSKLLLDALLRAASAPTNP